MNLTTDHLADLLIGIARAQNAVIDAMERASPGFRNTHAVPLITLAANMRAGDPRLIDLSSRILMRLQGRVALERSWQNPAEASSISSSSPDSRLAIDGHAREPRRRVTRLPLRARGWGRDTSAI